MTSSLDEFATARLDFTSLLTLAFGIVILSIAAYGLYNAYLHPLSKYPGPRLWTAYRLPYVLNAIQGVLTFRVLEFHRRYGPVVRIAPNELAFVDAAAWRDIQGLLPGRRQNKKDFHMYTPPEPTWEGNIIHASDANHARIRRIYAPAFTAKAVGEQGPLLMKYANLFVESLKKAASQNAVQDMGVWFNCTTFDLTGEFAFNESFHCLEQGGQYHFFLKTVFTGVAVGMVMAQLEQYRIWSLMRPLIPKSAFQAKVDMEEYTAALVDKRAEQGHTKDAVDVFNYLLQDKNGEQQLSRDELVQNGIVLVVAGSETTATLLSGTTWFLCKNRDKYKKVVKEVRSAFKTDDEITPTSVNELEYMRAVLSEVLRMFPPAGAAFPRIITNPAGQEVAGYFVPQGTRCGIAQYAANHYEGNFTRPDEFIPERWINSGQSEFAGDSWDVVQPFHTGPRDCLGRLLATAEMRVLLAKMLWHFNLELADPQDDWWAKLTLYSVWQRPSLKIRLQPV